MSSIVKSYTLRYYHRTRHRKDTKTHQKLAAAEALLRPIRRNGEVRDDRRGEASACLMMTLVRVSLRGVTGNDSALVQLRRPDLLFALRRLADRAMLGESGDPFGLHPVVVRTRLTRDRLQGLHGVEARKPVLHRGRPEMIRQIPGTALRLYGLPVRGRAQTGGGRRGRIISPIGRVLGVLDIRGVKVAVARLQRAIVLVQVQGRADAGRGGRRAAEASFVCRRPYLIRDRGTDPRRGRRRSVRASLSIAAVCVLIR